MTPESTRDLTELKQEIIRLGPWHLEVQVTPELSTRAFLDAPDGTYGSDDRTQLAISFLDHRHDYQAMIKRIYPNGLEGRSFLDCACNCGGYSFWMKEIGAGSCFGFDVREHWIDQANFLLEHRQWPSDGIRFELLDLYDLPNQGLEPFDVTLFKGIFYHLPDPIAGLRLAAELTREVIIVDTEVRTDRDDGMLVLENEPTAPLMSGVYGLNWIPTGPGVMARILNWMGFAETRLTNWVANPGGRGRLQIIGARSPDRLDRLRAVSEIRRRPAPGAPGEGGRPPR